MLSGKPRERRMYGCKLSPPDPRDHRFSAPHVVALPDFVDLRPHCSPVEDQRDANSCVANAVVGALEYMDRRAGGRAIDYSRLFVYWYARDLRGWQDQDEGCYIRDAIKVVAGRGVCPESLWPYNLQRVMVEPEAVCGAAAHRHLLERYARAKTLQDIQAALAMGYPVVGGFPVFEALESPEVAKSGLLPAPRPEDHILGYHAMMIAGYDAAAKQLIVRNSWGPEWGLNGYVKFPFAYAERGLIEDVWVIQARA